MSIVVPGMVVSVLAIIGLMRGVAGGVAIGEPAAEGTGVCTGERSRRGR